MTDQQDFLDEILYRNPGYRSLNWQEPGGSFSYKVYDDLDTLLTEGFKKRGTANVWFGCHALDQMPEKRGKNEDLSEMTHLHVDLDYAGPGHQDPQNKLPTKEAVDSAVEQIQPMPSFVVDSGGGYHLYWSLDEPIDRATFDQARAGVKAMCIDLGVKPERLEAASILRLPGTLNLKPDLPEPLLVTVKKWNGRTPVAPFLAAVPPPEPKPTPTPAPPVNIDNIDDTPANWYRHNIDWATELTAIGWTHKRTLSNGEQQWRHPHATSEQSSTLHPGNAEEGVGPLNVFSPTPGWEAWGKPADGCYSLSAIQFYAASRGIDITEASSRIRRELMPRTETPGDYLDSIPEMRRAITAEMIAALEPDDDYSAVDMTEWMAGKHVAVMPTLLTMSDDRSMLYIDRYNEIHGDSGAGKSWLIAYSIRELVNTGQHVMLVDLEDNPLPLIQRLRQIGADDNRVIEHLSFINPHTSFTKANVTCLIEQINKQGIVHVFIDSMGEALNLDGLNENDDKDVGPWIEAVCKRITVETGAGVTVLDHITKAADLPLHPSGSKRKRASVNGASWYVKAVQPFTKEAGGKVIAMCGKDRHGNYRTGEHVADFVMDNMTDDGCRLGLYPASGEAEAEDHRTQKRVELAVLAAEKYGDWLSNIALKEAMVEMGATGNSQALGGAIELALSRGFIRHRPGDRKGWHQYRFMKPYEDMGGAEWMARKDAEMASE